MTLTIHTRSHDRLCRPVPALLLCLLSLLWSSVSFAQEGATLQGQVRSGKGELLSGVIVQIKDRRVIDQTNELGGYSFSNLPLNIVITFTRLGYKTVSLELGLLPGVENIEDIILYPEVQSLDEINITEKFSGSNFKLIEPAKQSAYPNSSGSFENFLKNMPGVSVNNELSSQYSVRGGNYDENLVYINDVEIFRPQLFSKGQQEGLGAVNPDIAGTVRFSAGGFEARYGDKLSSVLDVRYTRPDSLSLEAAAGILGSSATFKLPYKSGFLLAGARIKRNQDLLERQNISGNYKSKFEDYQVFLKHDLTSKFSISVFGNYNGGGLTVIPGERSTEFGTSDDVLKLVVNYDGQESTRYRSETAALTLSYNFSNTFSLKWINSVSHLREAENTALLGWYAFDERDGGLGSGNSSQFLGRGSQYDFAQNRLDSRIFNSEIRLYKQYRQSFLEMGVKYQDDLTKDDISEFTAVDSTGFTGFPGGNWIFSGISSQNGKISVNRLSGFFQNTFTAGPYLTFAAGVRTNFNSFTKEFLVSPRLSFMYYPQGDDGFMLRFATGVYSQPPFYREMRNYNGSINPESRAQRSFQLLTGADYRFRGLGTTLKLTSEVYYKFLSRLTPYRIEDIRLRYFADQAAKGYAMGADLSLSGNFVKDLESTFRVSLMKTAEDIRDDVYYISQPGGGQTAVRPGYLRRPTDQWLNMGMLFQDRLLQNPTYKVHLNLVFASALPTGPPAAERYGDVFNIPAYKRVDIGFSKNFADPDGKNVIPFVKKYFSSLSLHAEIFNLLNFKNTASYLWLTDVDNIQYAVPNYLTFRKFNLRLAAALRYR